MFYVYDRPPKDEKMPVFVWMHALPSSFAYKLLIKSCRSEHQLCETSGFIKTSSGKNTVGLHLTFVFKFVFHKEFSCPPTPVLL